jgi:hypothetical protein
MAAPCSPNQELMSAHVVDLAQHTISVRQRIAGR